MFSLDVSMLFEIVFSHSTNTYFHICENFVNYGHLSSYKNNHFNNVDNFSHNNFKCFFSELKIFYLTASEWIFWVQSLAKRVSWTLNRGFQVDQAGKLGREPWWGQQVPRPWSASDLIQHGKVRPSTVAVERDTTSPLAAWGTTGDSRPGSARCITPVNLPQRDELSPSAQQPVGEITESFGLWLEDIYFNIEVFQIKFSWK